MLYPLTDLTDPAAFLRGARVPLTQSMRLFHRVEWAHDRIFLWSQASKPTASVDTWRAEIAHMGLALDLTDPDVARWCDQRIAEAVWREDSPFGPPPDQAAIRCGVESDWASTPCFFVATIGCEDGYTLRHPCLASITPTESNIPTARAALLRALFSR